MKPMEGRRWGDAFNFLHLGHNEGPVYVEGWREENEGNQPGNPSRFWGLAWREQPVSSALFRATELI